MLPASYSLSFIDESDRFCKLLLCVGSSGDSPSPYLRVRLPYYLYLGLLGGVALKVGLVSQFFMSLPILIGIARQVAKGNEQSSIQQIYRDFLPSIFLYTLVLGLLFFNASAFELSIVIQFLYPFVAIPCLLRTAGLIKTTRMVSVVCPLSRDALFSFCFNQYPE